MVSWLYIWHMHYIYFIHHIVSWSVLHAHVHLCSTLLCIKYGLLCLPHPLTYLNKQK